jgi:hypothetical protein
MQILKPLYSAALWLPVIMMPPSTGKVNNEKYRSGEAHSPKSTTSRPPASRPRSRACCKPGELNRPSRPRLIREAPCSRAMVA